MDESEGEVGGQAVYPSPYNAAPVCLHEVKGGSVIKYVVIRDLRANLCKKKRVRLHSKRISKGPRATVGAQELSHQLGLV